MPRQRTARLPLLDTAARRPESPRTRGGSPGRARLVAVALVLVSLALLTVYFRESSDGAVHAAQRIGASTLAPFEVAAERVARPFRDTYAWFSELVTAKGENARLEREVAELRRRVIENETAAQENAKLLEMLRFRGGSRFPHDFVSVATRVIVQPQNVFRQDVVVAAGASDGIRVDDPVITPDGLVGSVSEVAPNAAKVRLLTDQQSAASAFVVDTGASGIVLHGPSEALVLDRVPKDEQVEVGDVVATAGSRVGEYESLFPRGIQIGVVTSVSQRDIDLYKQIQVTPFVDFDSLQEVFVLVDKKRKR